MAETEHPIYTQGEPLLEREKQEELNDYRRRLQSGEELAPGERNEYLRLQKLADEEQKRRNTI